MLGGAGAFIVQQKQFRIEKMLAGRRGFAPEDDPPPMP